MLTVGRRNLHEHLLVQFNDVAAVEVVSSSDGVVCSLGEDVCSVAGVMCSLTLGVCSVGGVVWSLSEDACSVAGVVCSLTVGVCSIGGVVGSLSEDVSSLSGVVSSLGVVVMGSLVIPSLLQGGGKLLTKEHRVSEVRLPAGRETTEVGVGEWGIMHDACCYTDSTSVSLHLDRRARVCVCVCVCVCLCVCVCVCCSGCHNCAELRMSCAEDVISSP